MQLSTLLVVLAGTAGVMGDLHRYAYCTSRIQPIGNPNSCPKKRDFLNGESISMKRSRIDQRGSAYGDNAAATRKACAAYRNRNTGNNQWDKCPDCSLGNRSTPDGTYCSVTCESAGWHIGGDEFLYYCQQAGADGADAY